MDMSSGLSKIIEGLYVGSIFDARNLAQLEAKQITHILSVLGNSDPRDPVYRVDPYLRPLRNSFRESESRQKVTYNNDSNAPNVEVKKILDCLNNGGKCFFDLYPDLYYLCILLEDDEDEDIIQYFRLCNDYIHSVRLSGNSVLVHCVAGRSRSVTIVCAYLILTLHMKRDEALSFIQNKRPPANPNRSFRLQLRRYELDYKQESTRFFEKFAVAIEKTHKAQEDKENQSKTSRQKKNKAEVFLELFSKSGPRTFVNFRNPQSFDMHEERMGTRLEPGGFFYRPPYDT